MPTSIRSDWITESYDERLAEFASDQDVPRSRVKTVFCEHCETFQGHVVEDTPPDIVRDLAYEKLQWHPPSEETSTA